MHSTFRSLVSAAFALAAGAVLTHAQVTPDTSQSYRIINVNSQLALGIGGGSQQAGAAAEQGAQANLWHFVPQGNGEVLILNVATREVLGISNASRSLGAAAVMWADNSTADHLWTPLRANNGDFQFRNANSGLMLGISGQSRSNNAPAVQESASGSGTFWILAAAGAVYSSPLPAQVSYNPGDFDTIHDPSMIRAGNVDYLFSTHSGIRVHRSTNLVTFADDGTAFRTAPGWTNGFTRGSGDLWAPDVSFHDGQYWMYFAASTFGSGNSAIGVATSSTAVPGTWKDSGSPVLTSGSCPSSNAIDPSFVLGGNGDPWLVFGSFSGGIFIEPLDRASGRLVPGAKCTFLARRFDSAMEGAYVLHHGNFFYLFVSQGFCCRGVNSTYRIAVSRSSSVTGPYVDQAGLPTTIGGGTILLSTHGNIIGPGGQSVLSLPQGDLLVYHYYNGAANGTSTLGMNMLVWRNDWPELQ